MGTSKFTVHGEGTSMKDAFQRLYDEAKEEHGNDIYNGDINTTELSGDKTNAYNLAKDKNKFLNELMLNIDKRDTYGICLKPPKANTNKVKTKVNVMPQKGAKKWETRFVVTESWTDNQVGYGKTQGEAIKKARAHTEKTQHNTNITIEKVLVTGKTLIAQVEYKKSTKESLGKYLFVVAAAC
jgi:hypothetical protein